MSKPMTLLELSQLLRHVLEEHSPARIGLSGERRIVKYVDPHIDLRDGMCFSVGFRSFGWEQVVHTQNECRGLKQSLFDRCMEFLDA